MTANEVKDTFKAGKSVLYNGIKYSYINGFGYRRGRKGYYMFVELMDKNKNAIVTTLPENIKSAV